LARWSLTELRREAVGRDRLRRRDYPGEAALVDLGQTTGGRPQ